MSLAWFVSPRQVPDKGQRMIRMCRMAYDVLYVMVKGSVWVCTSLDSDLIDLYRSTHLQLSILKPSDSGKLVVHLMRRD